jgi:hypothetical protein
MLNQGSYGKMDANPESQPGLLYSVPCIKCKAVFLLSKPHKELFTQDMYWGQQKDGTLAPANPKNITYYRLCLACFQTFEKWITG